MSLLLWGLCCSIFTTLVFCGVFCRSLFVFLSFILAIVLPVHLRFTASDYPLAVLKLFVLYQHTELDCKSASSPRQKNIHVDMSFHLEHYQEPIILSSYSSILYT